MDDVEYSLVPFHRELAKLVSQYPSVAILK